MMNMGFLDSTNSSTVKEKLLNLVRSSKMPVNTSGEKLCKVFSLMYNGASTQSEEFFSQKIWNDISSGSEWNPDLINGLRVTMCLTTVFHRWRNPWEQLSTLLTNLKEKDVMGCYHGIATFLFSVFCNENGVSRDCVLFSG